MFDYPMEHPTPSEVLQLCIPNNPPKPERAHLQDQDPHKQTNNSSTHAKDYKLPDNSSLQT